MNIGPFIVLFNAIWIGIMVSSRAILPYFAGMDLASTIIGVAASMMGSIVAVYIVEIRSSPWKIGSRKSLLLIIASLALAMLAFDRYNVIVNRSYVLDFDKLFAYTSFAIFLGITLFFITILEFSFYFSLKKGIVDLPVLTRITKDLPIYNKDELNGFIDENNFVALFEKMDAMGFTIVPLYNRFKREFSAGLSPVELLDLGDRIRVFIGQYVAHPVGTIKRKT